MKHLTAFMLLAALAPACAQAQGGPTTTRAFPDAEWVGACRAALEKRVKRERPDVAAVKIENSSLEDWQISLRATGVRGSGDAIANGRAVPLTFRCTYDERLRAVRSLDYRLGKTGA